MAGLNDSSGLNVACTVSRKRGSVQVETSRVEQSGWLAAWLAGFLACPDHSERERDRDRDRGRVGILCG